MLRHATTRLSVERGIEGQTSPHGSVHVPSYTFGRITSNTFPTKDEDLHPTSLHPGQALWQGVHADFSSKLRSTVLNPTSRRPDIQPRLSLLSTCFNNTIFIEINRDIAPKSPTCGRPHTRRFEQELTNGHIYSTEYSMRCVDSTRIAGEYTNSS